MLSQTRPTYINTASQQHQRSIAQHRASVSLSMQHKGSDALMGQISTDTAPLRAH